VHGSGAVSNVLRVLEMQGRFSEGKGIISAGFWAGATFDSPRLPLVALFLFVSLIWLLLPQSLASERGLAAAPRLQQR